MPFIHLPERQINQYYCTNPTWHYSSSLSTAPLPGVLDPNKPILFLIHCEGSSSAAQQRQFHDARFKSAFNLIAMDAALHGWSTGAHREEGNYSIREVALNFLAAFDKLYAPRKISFSVLGEGHFGSNCAIWMAKLRPESVESIILVSPCRMQENEEGLTRMREWVELCNSNKNGNGDLSGRLPAEALTFTNEYYFAGSDRDKERQAIFASAFQQRYGAGHSSHDLVRLTDWLKDPRPTPEELAKITVPVLILAGEIDQISPLSAAEEWRDHFTGVPGGAQLHLVKSAPHLLMYAESGVANRVVFRFLTAALHLDPAAGSRPTFF